MTDNSTPRSGPVFKRLGAVDDEGLLDLNVPISVEVKFATGAKIRDMALLEAVIDLALADVEQRFEKEGFKLYARGGLVKPMTQEELLAMVPRKKHMAREHGPGMRQICDTPHVARKHLVTSIDKVTCKRCLKLIDDELDG
jgi:hypothetical protein